MPSGPLYVLYTVAGHHGYTPPPPSPPSPPPAIVVYYLVSLGQKMDGSTYSTTPC
jgi:hypothetical protein